VRGHESVSRPWNRFSGPSHSLWGAPRVHGELLKLGIDVSQATVAKYLGRRRQPPSQTWQTFLRNHVDQIVAADFFVVPTATYRLLFVLVLLAHDRRRIRHVAVTAHPTAAWTAQQLREAFPWNEAPRYLLHDRDHAFELVEATAKAMGIEEVVTAPQSPWQNAFVERFIGSVRRDCLDHVIVFNEAGLLRLMTLYRAYYERSRTHLSLDKDAPISRPVATAGDGAPSWRSLRSAASIIATNAARPETPIARSARVAPTRAAPIQPRFSGTFATGRRPEMDVAPVARPLCSRSLPEQREHAEHVCRVRVQFTLETC
jgi:transposase InsO family protein